VKNHIYGNPSENSDFVWNIHRSRQSYAHQQRPLGVRLAINVAILNCYYISYICWTILIIVIFTLTCDIPDNYPLVLPKINFNEIFLGVFEHVLLTRRSVLMIKIESELCLLTFLIVQTLVSICLFVILFVCLLNNGVTYSQATFVSHFGALPGRRERLVSFHRKLNYKIRPKCFR